MAEVQAIGGATLQKEKRTLAAAPEDERNEEFDATMNSVQDIKVEPKNSLNPLQDFFTDPDKMLKLWLSGETRPNPFANEQKDLMDTFVKFTQSMLMQTQTTALTKLQETMDINNRYSASALIGEMVEIETNKMTISPTNKTVENFRVGEEVDAFYVEIKNSDDEIVYQKMVEKPGAGINQFTWSGIDNNEKQLPLGEYKVSIELFKKKIEKNSPPKFEHIEYAKDLSGVEIHDKAQTLSAIDRDIQFSYEIPEGLMDLAYASVWISDTKGHIVHKGEIEVQGGKKGVYSWNCLDSAGHIVPEDIYTVQFNLKNGQHKMLKTDKQAIIRVSGKVHGIEVNENGEPNLITSRIKAPLSTVKQIVSEEGL